jgi:hypothetical protein
MKRAMPVVLILAMALGLAGGLVYAWGLDPVEIKGTTPKALRTRDKIVYLAAIGDLYAHDRDLSQAKARLVELGVQADGPALAAMIEQYLDSGGQPEEVRNLSHLAEALGASGGVLQVFAVAPTPSLAPATVISSQPGASSTPAVSPTPAPNFRLIEQTALCAQPGQPGRIEVWVRDTVGNELPGMEIVASWSAGQDRFFTGLRPEQGPGYADLQMTPHEEYEVALAAYSGDTAQGLTSDLQPGVCPEGTVAQEWRLTFQQSP